LSLGNAIGQIVPILFVEKASAKGNGEDDDSYDVVGMSDLMLTELILCLIPLIVGFFVFKDAPPTPPSQSTKLKVDKVSIILYFSLFSFCVVVILFYLCHIFSGCLAFLGFFSGCLAFLGLFRKSLNVIINFWL
jgi:hypothetical protein